MNKTILLFGGDSDERLVSTASGMAMSQHLPAAKLWFWHEHGAIYEVSKEELLAHKNPFNQALKPSGLPLFSHIKDAINSPLSEGFTFVLGLHGGSGENGYIQILLEEAGRAFTGSGSQASRLAFDKVKAKEALKDQPIKLAPQMLIKIDETIEEKLNDFYDQHQGFILKPICGGSSLGCIFVKKASEIKKSVAELKTFGRDFLAEKLIEGREITVGVTDSKNGLMALPATEIIIDKNREFDYEGKYLGAGSQEITPANISAEILAEAQRISMLVHKTLNLFGYSRSDLILGNDGIYFLEVNTLPGLTKSSLVPQQLACAGIPMAEFLEYQILLAKQRIK